jgi:hypothetical protein
MKVVMLAVITLHLELICPSIHKVLRVVDFLFCERERNGVLPEFVPELETAPLHRSSCFRNTGPAVQSEAATCSTDVVTFGRSRPCGFTWALPEFYHQLLLLNNGRSWYKVA